MIQDSVRPQDMRTPASTVLALAVVLLPACREQPSPAPVPAASTTTAPRSSLTRVPSSSLVCMVNDRFMGTEQIPVPVGDKTYYGCCAGCKDKLQNSAAARTAIDPVTHTTVDKASAVIAKNDTGKVFYFESEKTLAEYRSSN